MSYQLGAARGTIEDPEATLRRVHAWSQVHEGETLLADARAIFGRDHLESAVRHALRAQSSGRMMARSLALETLRYLSAQRQVIEAIKLAGIRAGTQGIAIVVFGHAALDDLIASESWVRDDRALEPKGKAMELLGISAAEAETVPPERRADLVLERVALLDISR